MLIAAAESTALRFHERFVVTIVTSWMLTFPADYCPHLPPRWELTMRGATVREGDSIMARVEDGPLAFTHCSQAIVTWTAAAGGTLAAPAAFTREKKSDRKWSGRHMGRAIVVGHSVTELRTHSAVFGNNEGQTRATGYRSTYR